MDCCGMGGSLGFKKGFHKASVSLGIPLTEKIRAAAPELVVSLVSAVKGKSMIALGNVVGSNICNIALVLGLTAVFQPVKTHREVITRDIPLMLIISAFLLLLSLDSEIGRTKGVVLFSGIIAYTWFNYKVALQVKRTLPVLFHGSAQGSRNQTFTGKGSKHRD